MNEKQVRLLETIKKLLALADPSRGATEQEALTAMAKAKQIMTQNGIDMMEVESSLSSDSRPSFQIDHETVVMDRQQKYDFDMNIARILMKCFGVQIMWSSSYVNGKRHHAYMMIGTEMDREMAKIALPLLVKAMWTGVRRLLKERGEKWTARVGRPYYDGLERGYIDASAQGQANAYRVANKAKVDAYAIVLVDKAKAITAYMEKKWPMLRKGKTSSYCRNGYDASSFARGFADGSQLDLSGAKLNKSEARQLRH